MFKRAWVFVDKQVDRFGYWWALLVVLGLNGGVSAFFGWVFSKVDALSAYGWPEFALAGFTAACVLLLTVSLFLIAWRYFNPAPPSTVTPPSTPVVEMQPPSPADNIPDQIHRLNINLGQVGGAYETLQTRLETISTRVDGFNSIIEKLTGDVASLSSQIDFLFRRERLKSLATELATTLPAFISRTDAYLDTVKKASHLAFRNDPRYQNESLGRVIASYQSLYPDEPKPDMNAHPTFDQNPFTAVPGDEDITDDALKHDYRRAFDTMRHARRALETVQDKVEKELKYWRAA